MPHVLIAEDEARIASFIEKGLRSHGFMATTAADASSALDLALSHQFDLLILDLGLPGMDGLQVLEQIRGQGELLPVIILTARDDIQDKVAGFEGGADDYVTKPFRFEELLVRIKARLRDRPAATGESELMLQVGSLRLDLRSRQIDVGTGWIELPTREFALAEMFFRNPGQTLTREQLLDRVWGYDYDPGSNIVDVYIGYLRKKLGNPIIQTVRGSGYRLQA